jgi:hypothetical protein
MDLNTNASFHIFQKLQELQRSEVQGAKYERKSENNVPYLLPPNNFT